MSSEADQDVLKAIEKRFEVALPYVLHPTVFYNTYTNKDRSEFPEGGVDSSTYMAN